MSNTIYGALDTLKEYIGCTSKVDEDLLYDLYYYNSPKELHNICKKEYTNLSQSEKDTWSDYDEYYNDFLERYFPDSTHDDYDDLIKSISLKDINFTEKIWQNLMVYFDNEYNFPAKNLCLVSIEESNEDSLQRVDLLYIRTDGKLLPAEIKISDNGRDVHGQLIRYIAGFSKDSFTVDKILTMGKKLSSDNFKNLENFIKEHKIEDQNIDVIETTGLLICEEYHKDTITAIRYLNEKTNLDIKMYDIDLFVDKEWNKNMERFIFKIDLSEVV